MIDFPYVSPMSLPFVVLAGFPVTPPQLPIPPYRASYKSFLIECTLNSTTDDCRLWPCGSQGSAPNKAAQAPQKRL